VIGERSFHGDPVIVTKLARATIHGIHSAGMYTVGKHFPGHGSVTLDTHKECAIDIRDYATIEATDLIPFSTLSPYLDAMMTAHIVYSKVDPIPCSFSSTWLQTILRKKLNFTGAIFTDDLSMQAAQTMGNISERVELALQAGCDGLLICNNRADAISALEYLEGSRRPDMPNSKRRLQKLFSHRTLGDIASLQQTAAWREAVCMLNKL